MERAVAGAADGGQGIVCEALTRGYASTLVLKNVSLVASPGLVYVVLGSGGAGKSTLLASVVGELFPETGRVCVLGLDASEQQGPLLGYMPQELGLFTDLSVMENLNYFGSLNHMSSEDVETSYVDLQRRLALPERDERVGSLSGGLQKLVSLAAALQHAPRVLVLDEPVAGLDVLRTERAWTVLRERAHEEGVTVLVAAHAVDDTRHADRVGFMRAGRLLAEGSSAGLCAQYGCSRLEQVFGALCLQDDHSFLPIVRRAAATPSSFATSFFGTTEGDPDFREFEPVSDSDGDLSPRGSGLEEFEAGSGATGPRSSENDGLMGGMDDDERAQMVRRELGRRCVARRHRGWRLRPHGAAVVGRQVRSLRHSWLLLLLQLVLPTLQALVFLLFVGPAPSQLPVAVVQQDFSGTAGHSLATLINASDTLETLFYRSIDAAKVSIEEGPSLAAVFIPADFTKSLDAIMHCPACVNMSVNSLVTLFLDYGDYQVYSRVEDVLAAALNDLTLERYNSSLHLYTAEPIKHLYGDVQSQFVRYVAPGYLALTSFCFAMFVSVLVLHWERKRACLGRALASGLRPAVVVVSSLVLYGFLAAIQALTMLFITLAVFDLPVDGSYGLVVLVLWLCATSGLTTGLLISAATTAPSAALQTSVALAFLLLSLSGVLWPLLAVPDSASWVAFLLPVTWAAQAFRDIYNRGWGLEHRAVWLAIVVPVVWSILCLLTLSFLVRPRRRLIGCCLGKRKPMPV